MTHEAAELLALLIKQADEHQQQSLAHCLRKLQEMLAPVPA